MGRSPDGQVSAAASEPGPERQAGGGAGGAGPSCLRPEVGPEGGRWDLTRQARRSCCFWGDPEGQVAAAGGGPSTRAAGGSSLPPPRLGWAWSQGPPSPPPRPLFKPSYLFTLISCLKNVNKITRQTKAGIHAAPGQPPPPGHEIPRRIERGARRSAGLNAPGRGHWSVHRPPGGRGQWPLRAEGPAGDKGPLCVGAASARHSERPGVTGDAAAHSAQKGPSPESAREREREPPALCPRPSGCPGGESGRPGPTLPPRGAHLPAPSACVPGSLLVRAGEGSARPQLLGCGVGALSPVPGQAGLWAPEAGVWEQERLWSPDARPCPPGEPSPGPASRLHQGHPPRSTP